MSTFDLSRFRDAQARDGSFAEALRELRSGRKTTHWIRWVFPQIEGLGLSPTSVRFAVAGRAEAHAYLADALLRARLVEAVEAAHAQLMPPNSRRIECLMGSEIDALKLVSSMTLFAEVAGDAEVRNLPDVARLGTMAAEILGAARGSGYPACSRTLERLRVG